MRPRWRTTAWSRECQRPRPFYGQRSSTMNEENLMFRKIVLRNLFFVGLIAGDSCTDDASLVHLLTAERARHR